MKKRLLLVSLWVASIGIASGSLDTDKIDQVTGLKGKLNENQAIFEMRPLLKQKNDLWNQWAVLPLRLIIGFGFMAHGWAKWSRGPEKFGELLHQIGLPFPGFTAWVVTFLEFFGGMAILAGILVSLVSIPLVISMLVATFSVQLKYGFSSINTIGLTKTGPVFGPPGYEINLLYIAALLLLALSNPTPLSVDRCLARRRLRRAPGRDNN